MSDASHSQRILELAKQNGLIRASDLSAIGSPRIVLRRMTDAGQLEKVGRGLYRLPGHVSSEYEGLTIVAKKVPQAIFCLLTALQFHELTTQLPRQIWIAMPRGSHVPRLDYPPVKMLQISGEAYTTGVEEHQKDGVTLRVYSVAKTVVDCFKYRNKVGLDVAIEALKEAREKRLTTVDELWAYAKICRTTNVIRPYLEATE